MTKVQVSAVIDEPVEQVWARVRNFGEIADWHPAVEECVLADGSSGNEMGSVRVLTLWNEAALREKLTAHADAERSFTTEILESPLPIENHSATLRLDHISDGDCTLAEWTAEFDVAQADEKAVRDLLANDIFQAGLDGLKAIAAPSGPGFLGRLLAVFFPKGSRARSASERKKILRFAGYGISFRHPRSMKVSSEKESGIATISLEDEESLFAMIQLYPSPTTVGEVRKLLMESFKTEFTSQEAKFLKGSGGPVKRNIQGVEREGRILDFELGGQRLNTEIYAIPEDKRVVAVILQHAVADAELAAEAFPIITDSLE